MEINIYDEVEYGKLQEERLNSIFVVILEKISKVGNFALSVSLVTEEKIQEINKQYRNIDSITDVISFESEMDEIFMHVDEPIDIGDIFICLKRAQEQAQSLNQSLERELEFLFIHGVLHLFGYDHLTKAEEEVMFSLQKLIVDEIN